jgi:type IV pilus assembly protein PilC
MMVVVPRFSEMFASRGIELPLPTMIVIGISDLLKGYWYLFLGGTIGAVMAARRAWRSEAVRRKVDTWMHRIPLLRDLLTGVAVSRFSDVFGMSLRSGQSLIDALELASRASGRPLLQIDVETMCAQVNSGRRLADAINSCEYFPPLSRRLLIAGEEAGEIPKMCEIVARDYDREVLHLSKNITTVIEPVLIIGLASVVLLNALAIFLPMWNMASLVG